MGGACSKCNAQRTLAENRGIASLYTPQSLYTVTGSQYNSNARSETVQPVNYNGPKPLQIGGTSTEAECAEVQQNIHAVDEVLPCLAAV